MAGAGTAGVAGGVPGVGIPGITALGGIPPQGTGTPQPGAAPTPAPATAPAPSPQPPAAPTPPSTGWMSAPSITPSNMLQMPQGLNQQVAPLSPYQTGALSAYGATTPEAVGLTGQGADVMSTFASGANLYPSSNPMLSAYYNAAALPMTQNYQTATLPGIIANAAGTGSVGGTGYKQGITSAQEGLGQGLGTLAANTFEPAYQQGQQLQYNAGANLPNAAMSLFSPLSALYGAGATQQQNAQNILNTQYQNSVASTQWPFQILNQLAGAFGTTAGAGGTTKATEPYMMPNGSKM